jgi:hypothetical protein
VDICDKHLLYVVLAKFHNFQDILLKFYVKLGHPKKYNVSKFYKKKYSSLRKLLKKNRVSNQDEQSIGLHYADVVAAIIVCQNTNRHNATYWPHCGRYSQCILFGKAITSQFCINNLAPSGLSQCLKRRFQNIYRFQRQGMFACLFYAQMTCSGRALERQNISILVHTAPSCHSD